MSRLFIGIDSNGVPALKITRSSLDDPYSTPDSERSKFSYNSNDEDFADINEVVPLVSGSVGAGWSGYTEYPNSPNAVRVYYYPDGTDATTYEIAVVRGVVGGVEQMPGEALYSSRYFENLRYSCPLLSDFSKDEISGKYANVQTLRSQSVVDGGYVITVTTHTQPGGPQSVRITDATSHVGSSYFAVEPANASVATGSKRTYLVYQSTGGVPTIAVALRDVVAHVKGAWGGSNAIQAVWNLPGDNTAIDKAPKITGTSGVKAIKINPSEFKIARQGYSADTATYEKLSFSAERRPAKVIAAGDVAISANSTHTVECEIDLNDVVVVEQAMYVSTPVTFPFPYNLYIDDTWNFEYQVTGSTVVFYNDTNQTYRVRYLIIAADDAPRTSGSNKVFRQIDVSGEKVFQVLRPGAADPPSLADIIIDSRWPSIPILAEGYLDVQAAYLANPTAGYQTFTVNFLNPSGLFPFIKFAVLRETGVSGKYVACPPVVRKRVGPMSGGSDFSRLGGDTTYCTLPSNTQAVFHTFRGRIIELGSSQAVSDNHPTVGLRYYIFGIPS